MPVLAAPGRSVNRLLKVNDPVGDGGWMTFSRSQRRSAPDLERVPALQPGERVGDLRHAGAEVGRGVRRRSELLVAADQERRQRVRETARSTGMPGMPSAADAEVVELRRRAADRPPRVADAQLVQQRCSRTCAGSSTRTTTPWCPAGRACRW